MSTRRAAITLYHNPRCGKSRSALDLLQGKGVEPRVVEYLKTPPTRAELAAIVKKLGVKPEAIVRTGEEIYKERYKGKAMTDAQWLDALAAHPILIERPIAVKGERAVLGRPPENVLKLV
ncbi:MAG: arsenate reductase (glutaredoxin) [Betaproteobacteria bacterium]|nr:arsenate reductase (glutaredoxin) [Betaproteobacteria bacterium]